MDLWVWWWWWCDIIVHMEEYVLMEFFCCFFVAFSLREREVKDLFNLKTRQSNAHA